MEKIQKEITSKTEDKENYRIASEKNIEIYKAQITTLQREIEN